MLLKTLWRITKTASMTLGGLFVNAGIQFFSIGALFDYFKIESPVALLGSRIMALSTSIYVFIFSRGLSNWRLMGEDPDHRYGIIQSLQNGLSKVNRRGKIIACSILGIGSLTSLIVFGLMSYFGSYTLFAFLGIKDPYILVPLSAYSALSTSITGVYYSLRIGIKNCFCMIDTFSHQTTKPIHYKKAASAFLIGSTQMLSELVVANMLTKKALTSLIPMSQLTNEALSGTIALSSIPLYSQNKSIQLYHYFMKEDLDLTHSSSLPPALKKLHLIEGGIYAFLFLAISFIGLADLEEQFHFNSRSSYFILFNLLQATGGATVEYAFTNRGMLRESRFLFFSPERIPLTYRDESDSKLHSPKTLPPQKT